MPNQRVAPPFLANPKQAELAKAWADPACRRVLISGAIRTGKTQGAGRLIVETALAQPALYLVARSTYRELEDSTKRAILNGDGQLPPLLPHEVRYYGGKDGYRASDNKVVLPNGAEILFRSLEENNIGKILNLTLGGIFIDQIEEIDQGEDGEHLFDTLLGRLSDPKGPRKLIGVANPAAKMHWVYRRFVDPETRDPSSRYIHVTMRDNAQNLPPGYVEEQEQTRETRPSWFKTFVLGEWGAFEGAAYPMFNEQDHVVDAFDIPEHWERFESMDHGSTHATCWLAWAVDSDGCLYIYDELYIDKGGKNAEGETHPAPHLPDYIAPLVKERRAWWWPEGSRTICHADPSVYDNKGVTNRWGAPATIANEYEALGIDLQRSDNDRPAGYLRLAQLMSRGQLKVFRHCTNVIQQLAAAPIELAGEPHPGEAVSRKWEGPFGHAHAAARYGAITWPDSSEVPAKEWLSEDELRRNLLEKVHTERASSVLSRGRFSNV